jgi:phosphopantetheinyl transferase
MGMVLRLEWQNGACLSVWHNTASHPPGDSLGHHSSEDLAEFNGLRLEKRRTEWFTSRLALREGLKVTGKVLYRPNGQPYLEDAALSFSHCLPLGGALVAPNTAGLDIQVLDEKLKRIESKFAHPDELKAVYEHPNPLLLLTKLWSIKEAVFKVYGEHLPFIEGIRVNLHDQAHDAYTAKVVRKGQSHLHTVHTVMVQGAVVAYTAT